jgi:hypothetical protein
MGWTRAGAAVALVAVLGGCGSSSHPAAPVTGDYVGKTGGRTAAVAVVVGKANAVAYVCDWRRHVAELFTGSRSGERVALHGARGGRLSGIVARDQVTGTFTLKGRPVRFTAGVAKRPAGFYRARGRVQGKPATVGWVVLPGGSVRGAATIGSTVGPAPALNTSTSTATLSGGTRLTAVRISSTSVSGAGQIGTQQFGFGG